jgi:predicted nuclease of predicted toxin-antitoxin system
MRFLADMGIAQATVDDLRSLGHDAVHLREQELQRLPDPEILEKARYEERVLLTHDLDFSDLLAASGASLPSVVIFRLRDMQPANVNRHLEAVLREHAQELRSGAIVSVTEGCSRLRLLPV